MTVYNSDKTEILEEYDLEKGHLVEDTITVHVDAVEGQELEAYFDQSKNGEYTIVKPYIKAVEEHDEEQPILRYVPFTILEQIQFNKEKRKTALQIERAEKQAELESMDYIGVKIATGRATREEYAEQIARMTELANRINEIDEELVK